MYHDMILAYFRSIFELEDIRKCIIEFFSYIHLITNYLFLFRSIVDPTVDQGQERLFILL